MSKTKQKSKSKAQSHSDSVMPSRLPHRVGALLAAIVFPLIWVGGLVTTYDAGMAVPDWPNTYNYNMFAYPVRDWFLGPWDLFVEHGHRLLGSLAGLVAIALVIATWLKEPRNWVRWMSVGLLLLVIAQGVLGGMRVLLDERTLAKIHGCLGPAFFAAVIAYCVVTSRWWLSQENPTKSLENKGSRKMSGLIQWPVIMLLICFGQLVIGAFLRHIDVVSPPGLYASLILAHIITAVLIVVGTVGQFFWLKNSRYGDTKGLHASINVLGLLVLIQFALGLGTWVVKHGWPVWFEDIPYAAAFVVTEKSFLQMNLITAHVAVGSLLLGFWMIHALRLGRMKLNSIDIEDTQWFATQNANLDLADAT